MSMKKKIDLIFRTPRIDGKGGLLHRATARRRQQAGMTIFISMNTEALPLEPLPPVPIRLFYPKE